MHVLWLNLANWKTYEFLQESKLESEFGFLNGTMFRSPYMFTECFYLGFNVHTKFELEPSLREGDDMFRQHLT